MEVFTPSPMSFYETVYPALSHMESRSWSGSRGGSGSHVPFRYCCIPCGPLSLVPTYVPRAMSSQAQPCTWDFHVPKELAEALEE